MSYQLSLFQLDEPPNHDPVQLLRDGAALVLSVSGGKDSDAMGHGSSGSRHPTMCRISLNAKACRSTLCAGHTAI
jgi:hypothetical protein